MSKDGKLIRDMDTFLRQNINDEEAFMRWLYVVPDECTDDDCDYVAEDPEEFMQALKIFAELVLLEAQ